jgi:hypothetical protein
MLSPAGQRGVGLGYLPSKLAIFPLCGKHGSFDVFVTVWVRLTLYSW